MTTNAPTFEEEESLVRTQFINLKSLVENKGCCCTFKKYLAELEISFNRLTDAYERHINVLEGDYSNDQDTIEKLNDKIRYLERDPLGSEDIEHYSTAILKKLTGREPNLGEVVSLKEDLEKLLVNKYGINFTME